MKQSSFSDIYSRWESSHNEDVAIGKKLSGAEIRQNECKTVSQIRKMKVRDELDLHCVKLEDALVQTDQFIDFCYSKGFEKVRIITGKGIHSAGGKAVLRDPVIDRVRCNSHVRSVDTAPKAEDGGSGALIIYLKVKTHL